MLVMIHSGGSFASSGTPLRLAGNQLLEVAYSVPLGCEAILSSAKRSFVGSKVTRHGARLAIAFCLASRIVAASSEAVD